MMESTADTGSKPDGAMNGGKDGDAPNAGMKYYWRIWTYAEPVDWLFIAKLVLIYISMYSFRCVGTRLSAKIRLLYLRALFNQSVSTLDLLPSGEAANLITGGANTLQIGITDKVGMFFQFMALIIGSVAVAFKYSWQLTLVTSSAVVVTLLIFGFISPMFLKKIVAVN